MAKGKSTPHKRGCKSKMSVIGNEIRVKETCIMPRNAIKLAESKHKVGKSTKKGKVIRTTYHGVPIAKRDLVNAKMKCKGMSGSVATECVEGVKKHMKEARSVESAYEGGALGRKVYGPAKP